MMEMSHATADADTTATATDQWHCRLRALLHNESRRLSLHPNDAEGLFVSVEVVHHLWQMLSRADAIASALSSSSLDKK